MCVNKHRFSHEGIELETVKIDMDNLRSLLDEWDVANPEPEPPEIAMEPSMFQLKEARKAHALSKERGIPLEDAELIVAKEVGTVRNEKDPDYIASVGEWRWKRYLRAEEIVWTSGVVFSFSDGSEGTLSQANGRTVSSASVTEKMKKLVTGDGRFSLYSFIISNSELTWEAVMKEAKALGIKRHQRPILETIPTGEGEPQAIAGLGAIAARNNGISPAEYMRLPVQEQALILAVYLCDRWSAHYASVDHMEKERQRAKQSRPTGRNTR